MILAVASRRTLPGRARSDLAGAISPMFSSRYVRCAIEHYISPVETFEMFIVSVDTVGSNIFAGKWLAILPMESMMTTW